MSETPHKPEPLTIDFSQSADVRQHKSGKQRDRLPADQRPITADGNLLTGKQIRARARRRAKKELMTPQEQEYLYGKSLDEWDLEELARGRPRDRRGGFRGPKPKWINAQVHEEAMERFTRAVKQDMQTSTIDALRVVLELLNNEDTDPRGRPIVASGTKLDAAKFLIEHVIGKPKQHITTDLSIKLQGILGQVMVNPAEAIGPAAPKQYTLGHLPGVTLPMGEANDDVIDAEWDEYGA